MSGRTLEGVQEEADHVTNESLEATRRMVAMAENTRQVGAKTLENLDHQGEQLQRIEGGMNKVNTDLRRAEHELTGLEKCCGLCGFSCFKPNIERSKSYKSAWKDDGVIDEEPEGEEEEDEDGKPRRKGKQEFIQRVTGDAREDEMNDNLGVIHSIVGDLKKQALSMNEEIDKQNDMLDRINDKAESNTKRVAMANQRVARLL